MSKNEILRIEQFNLMAALINIFDNSLHTTFECITWDLLMSPVSPIFHIVLTMNS